MELTKPQVLDAIKRGKAERLKEEIEYVRFRESTGKIMRGTVVTKDRVIQGFEHIPRIFTLEKGLEKNIGDGEIYIEEKIDGFNLRIAKVQGKIIAFSRGGYIDAFATEKARGMGLEGFFTANPNYVLCGEMIGNTPYTSPTNKYDVLLYVFDIDDGSGNYLQCEDRYAILKKNRIESVPVLGRFKTSDIKKIRDLALVLNKAKKEGMVIKTLDRKAAIKYVTPNADIEDIEKCSPVFFDMPIGFYIQRIFRSGLFIRDFGLDMDEYSRRLGRALYDGLRKGVDYVDEGRGAEEIFEIFVKSPETWETIHKHMSREVKLEVLFNRDEGKGKRIRFRKIYKKTTKRIREALAGKGVTD